MFGPIVISAQMHAALRADPRIVRLEFRKDSPRIQIPSYELFHTVQMPPAPTDFTLNSGGIRFFHQLAASTTQSLLSGALRLATQWYSLLAKKGFVIFFIALRLALQKGNLTDHITIAVLLTLLMSSGQS